MHLYKVTFILTISMDGLLAQFLLGSIPMSCENILMRKVDWREEMSHVFQNLMLHGVFYSKAIANSLKPDKNEHSNTQVVNLNLKLIFSGSYDFFTMNTYTTALIQATSGPDWVGDSNTTTFFDDTWEDSASDWLKVVPWG